MKVISLGWGVQSFGLAAMSALGVLPPVDAVVHADTGHEKRATCAFARRWTPWLEERGVRVTTVRAEDTAVIGKGGGVEIPAHTMFSGRPRQLKRQCTTDWKVRPIRRWLQQHRNGGQVELWLGITADEARRRSPSGAAYIQNRYPFLEQALWRGRALRRWDVERWLRECLGDDAVPPRSSCVFCPFQTVAEWRWLRDNAPQDWQRAIAVDRAIRDARGGESAPHARLYLTPSCVPLEELDLSTPEERGQGRLPLVWAVR